MSDSDIDRIDAGPLFGKLAQVMGEVGRVEKRGYNDFHKYHYALEADLVDAVREKLSAVGVALIPSIEDYDERPYQTTDRQGQVRESVVITVRGHFTFVDGESGATYSSAWIGQGDDGADKGAYKAMTGALKYFLMKTFLIPTGDDPEADAGTDARSAGRVGRSGRTSEGITASDKQIAFLEKLVKQKKVTVPQLNFMLIEVGAKGVQVGDGWTQKLTGGKNGTCSALIDWLQSRPLPDPDNPSDVPYGEPPSAEVENAEGTPWEGEAA